MAVTKVDRIAGGASVSIPVSLTTSMGATTTDGILLGATNSATAGAQVFSPALHFQGSGWKTDPTAGAQSCDWKIEAQPNQSTAAPIDYLAFSNSINGGAYTTNLLASETGLYTIGTNGTLRNSSSIANVGSGVYLWSLIPSQFYLTSGFVVTWASSATSAVTGVDTGLSRISAGLIGAGTGAAGDFAGALKLTRLVTAPLTFATLPASPSTGARCMITDATSTTFAALATTGGAIVMPVFYDGANWKIG